ncbi:MAG TPA: hypothetical protein VNJ46_08350 [Gaiellaceae bacterium]|nr:hypothetical protein [Gaiellaceae bacterium]
MDRRAFLLAAIAAPAALRRGLAPAPARAGGAQPVALVTADRESHVVVLDLASARVLSRLPTAPGPRAVEAVHGLTAVVAHTAHGLVSLLAASPLGLRAELDGFAAPRYAAAHPREPIAYVTDSGRAEVVALDVARARVLSRVAVPGPARHVTISPDGRTIWTALGTKAERVAVLDASDPRRPRLVRTLAPPFLAHDVVFAPDGRGVWVTSGAERRIALYEPAARRPSRLLPADAPPQHVGFSRGRAFVASGDDGTVRLHRLDGRLLRRAAVPVGSYNVCVGGGGRPSAVTPSLSRGTVALLDARGRVRAVRTVARAAHDACVLLSP